MSTTVSSRRLCTAKFWPALALIAIGCNSSSPPTTPTAFPPTTPTAPLPPGPPQSPGSLTTVFLPVPGPPPVSATDPLVGRYTLEIEAHSRSGLRCELLPEFATRRTYTADIHRVEVGRAVVKLYDAAFLADSRSVSWGCLGLGLSQPEYDPCHQFPLTGDPDALAATMIPPDDWRENEIWEALPDGFTLAIYGTAAGRVENGRIQLAGTGGLWYGNGLPATTSYACKSDDLRLTFTPR